MLAVRPEQWRPTMWESEAVQSRKEAGEQKETQTDTAIAVRYGQAV
jgi:hypothetical protein